MRKKIILLGYFLFRLTLIVIFLCNMFVLCLYEYLQCDDFHGYSVFPLQLAVWQRIVFLLVIFLYFLAGVLLFRHKKEKLTRAIPSRRLFYRKIFSLFSIALFLFLQIDDTPPEDLYSIDDITSDENNIKQSQLHLNTIYYAEGTFIEDLIDLKKDTGYANIEEYAEKIEKAWRGIDKQREAVRYIAGSDKVLQQFEEHYWDKPTANLKVAAIYQAHALLNARYGDFRNAINDLVSFQKTIRKGLEGSVSLIQKMLWLTAARENLRTAFQLTCEYNLDQNHLSAFAEAFSPFTKEEESFYKPWIGEYLSLQKSINLSFYRTVEAKIYDPEHHDILYQFAKKLPEPLVEFLYQLVLQKNRTAQQVYAFWMPLIEKSKTAVSVSGDNRSRAVYPFLPLRNIGGAWYHKPPRFLAYGNEMIKGQIRYNMFTEFLENKINSGKEGSRLEKNTILRNNGPDQKARTDDDVVLELYYPVAQN
jgi:hypothetical protein